MRARAAILKQSGLSYPYAQSKPLHIETITLAPPGPDEVLVRIAAAGLCHSDLSVINVALACGFSSPSHFSKCYRSFYGRTPYRERGVPVSEAA